MICIFTCRAIRSTRMYNRDGTLAKKNSQKILLSAHSGAKETIDGRRRMRAEEIILN